MMVAPNNVPLSLREARQGEAHQRRGAKIKAAPAIIGQQFPQARLMLFRVRIPPIQQRQTLSNVSEHRLKHLRRLLPDKRRSQGGMPLRNVVPRLFERRYVQRPAQQVAELFDINATLRLKEDIEQHALLQRRERVNSFYFSFRDHLTLVFFSSSSKFSKSPSCSCASDRSRACSVTGRNACIRSIKRSSVCKNCSLRRSIVSGECMFEL